MLEVIQVTPYIITAAELDFERLLGLRYSQWCDSADAMIIAASAYNYIIVTFVTAQIHLHDSKIANSSLISFMPSRSISNITLLRTLNYKQTVWHGCIIYSSTSILHETVFQLFIIVCLLFCHVPERTLSHYEFK